MGKGKSDAGKGSRPREVRTDAKLANLDREQIETLWWLRYDEEGRKLKTLDEILPMLPELVGMSVAKSTLSEFYAWAGQQRELDAAVARAEQATLQFSEEHPEATPEQLLRYGKMRFTASSIEEGNGKMFLALLRAEERAKDREQAAEKMRAAARSKIEAGLDALAETIRGNKAAEKLFRELKETVAKA